MTPFVICVKNDGYEASLELRKLYEVIDDPFASEHGQLRVVDESGEDYLYPTGMFAKVELPSAVHAQVESAAYFGAEPDAASRGAQSLGAPSQVSKDVRSQGGDSWTYQ